MENWRNIEAKGRALYDLSRLRPYQNTSRTGNSFEKNFIGFYMGTDKMFLSLALRKLVGIKWSQLGNLFVIYALSGQAPAGDQINNIMSYRIIIIIINNSLRA